MIVFFNILNIKNVENTVSRLKLYTIVKLKVFAIFLTKLFLYFILNINVNFLFIYYTGTMIIRSIFFVAFVLYFSISLAIKVCDRKPTSLTTPKSTNPHTFRVTFKGNVEFYTPGTTYTGNQNYDCYK